MFLCSQRLRLIILRTFITHQPMFFLRYVTLQLMIGLCVLTKVLLQHLGTNQA